MKNTLRAAFAATAFLASGAITASAQAEASLGDIILVGFNFCPRGYADTHGQLLPINTNQALFSLLGCNYGGDCRTTFALPDLRGRIPVSYGQGVGLPDHALGARFGSETTTMLSSNMPDHSHAAFGTTSAPNEETPAGNSLASFPAGTTNIYSTGPLNETMAPGVIAPPGGSQPISVIAPTTTLRYCIATQGVFPSRN